MKYFIMFGLVGLVVAFQNCSGKSFSSRTDLSKPLSVETEQLVEEEIPEDIVEDIDNDIVKEEDKEHEDEEKEYTKKDEPKKYDNRHDDDDDGDKVVAKERTSCKNKKDGNARFVCILAGAGKSTHVAVVDDKIIANNSTPKTACMSERACEDIVGNKMDVKSVESRGYCKNGTPQVLMFTDADIKRLMDKVQ